MKRERIFQSATLTKGFSRIGVNSQKLWWFDTLVRVPKQNTLDKNGVPISWDDMPCAVDGVKHCTGDNVCTLILSNGTAKAVAVVFGHMSRVVIHGNPPGSISWDDYAKRGLAAVKEKCPDYSLTAVVINPRARTLTRYGVFDMIIHELVNPFDLTKR